MSNENKEICTKCGGRCCNTFPGITHPEDFDYSERAIRSSITIGNYSIDLYDNSVSDWETILFVRPSIKGSEKMIFHESGGGCCTFHEIKSCILNYNSRPRECRDLTPKEGGGCYGVNKILSAKWWLPYQEFLQKIKKEQVEL